MVWGSDIPLEPSYLTGPGTLRIGQDPGMDDGKTGKREWRAASRPEKVS